MLKMRNDFYTEVAELLRQARGRVLVLTGAGISQESGIPTFRGRGGLWEKYDPEKYANMPGLLQEFEKDPLRIARYLFDFYEVLIQARPNPAHLALAEMEKRGYLSGVITQNIDNLHQDAGSKRVWEVHGNAFRVKCESCGAKKNVSKPDLAEQIAQLPAAKNRFQVIKNILKIFPRCKCSGYFRTDVVLFGELLPQEVLDEIYACLEDCALMLVVGTSAVVYPAAGIPVYAKEKGARLVEVNTEKSALTDLCDCSIFEKAGNALPKILNQI
jgi:NAD-dependent deacetylase